MSDSDGRKHSIQLTDRDLALLRGLFECRIMTIEHVGVIYFDGAIEYAKKRLRQLKEAGYIRERPRRVMEKSVLSLARDGLMLLRDGGFLTDYPQFSLRALLKRADVSERTVKHELAVMDVKAAFHRAVRGSPTLSIAEFGTWPRLYQFEAYHPRYGLMTIHPDGFIQIVKLLDQGQVRSYRFFLEVDRSTETLDTLVERIACYRAYYWSGDFACRCGKTREEYRQYPFRVLIVCQSAQRRNTLAERLLQHNPPILTQILLSTHTEVSIEPFDTIWVTPQDTCKCGNQFTSASQTRSLVDTLEFDQTRWPSVYPRR